MFCSNCGKEVKEQDRFCQNCGKLNDHYQEEETLEPKTVAEEPLKAEETAPEATPVTEPASEETLYDLSEGTFQSAPETSAPAPQTAEPAGEPKKENPVFGILALVFSLVSFIGGSTWVPGLVFSIIGLNMYKDKASSNRKRAKAGLILSIISVVLWFFIFFVIGIVWAVFQEALMEALAESGLEVVTLMDWLELLA